MKYLKKFIFIYLVIKFYNWKHSIPFIDLNFKKLDFTNYKQIRSFIFKKNFYKLNYKYVQNFEFLNVSQNLGGEIGINLSKKNILRWYNFNKNKFNYPWTTELTAKRLINMLYNFEFINSSSNISESKQLIKIIFIHIRRLLYDFKNNKITAISSYEVKAILLSYMLIGKLNSKLILVIEYVLDNDIDTFGMHKSYNILEHAKFINNFNEIKDILLAFNKDVPEKIDLCLLKMKSILIQYFHLDGSIPLFNGANNNYTKLLSDSLNKDEFLKNRQFFDIKNGLASYSDKNKKIFFDVVQPNNTYISKNLSAGTLSFEFSASGEKIITNCGASESIGANPEFLRYSAAHSTIVLQNTNISEIKENNPHIKYPQSVLFNSEETENAIILEGSHNGYLKKFDKIVKRKLLIDKFKEKIFGEDTVIPLKGKNIRVIYHIRFHLMPETVFNFTNSKKNIILRTKLGKMWVFKSDTELKVENSILVDINKNNEIKQIVISGVIKENKQIRKWSIEKI